MVIVLCLTLVLVAMGMLYAGLIRANDATPQPQRVPISIDRPRRRR